VVLAALEKRKANGAVQAMVTLRVDASQYAQVTVNPEAEGLWNLFTQGLAPRG
jgi:hypothetical protein